MRTGERAGHDDVGRVRPTWALIDEAAQAAGIAEGFANTIAQRRSGADRRAAWHAAEAFKRGARMLALVEREEPDGVDA